MNDLQAIALFVLGAMLPLFASAMVPRGRHSTGAILFSLIGLCVLVGMSISGHTAFGVGIACGIGLAATKLAAGIRYF